MLGTCCPLAASTENAIVHDDYVHDLIAYSGGNMHQELAYQGLSGTASKTQAISTLRDTFKDLDRMNTPGISQPRLAYQTKPT
jgi:hypothetical protein